MNCDEANVLLHALIDGELDAGHARDVEAHIAGCTTCATALDEYRRLHDMVSTGLLAYAAPPKLRARLDHAIPGAKQANRRELLTGIGLGAVATAIAASGAFLALPFKNDQQILNEIVSAHLRSLQGNHLTDVQSSDHHTVKPWFNGRLDVAPPVIDLNAQGFKLVGGRLDYLEGKPVAAIVYRGRTHIINLFVSSDSGLATRAEVISSVHGFNIWRKREQSFGLWAISDIEPDELIKFGKLIEIELESQALPTKVQ